MVGRDVNIIETVESSTHFQYNLCTVMLSVCTVGRVSPFFMHSLLAHEEGNLQFASNVPKLPSACSDTYRQAVNAYGTPFVCCTKPPDACVDRSIDNERMSILTVAGKDEIDLIMYVI